MKYVPAITICAVLLSTSLVSAQKPEEDLAAPCHPIQRQEDILQKDCPAQKPEEDLAAPCHPIQSQEDILQKDCPAQKLKEDLTAPCHPIQRQGDILQKDCPAFNAPAAIYVSSNSNWKAFIDLSFTYWHASEDGLKIATTALLNAGTLSYNQNTTVLEQSFGYHPGFKVGIGIVKNNEWEVFANYTWFRGSNQTHNSSFSSSPTTARGTEVWAIDDWFLQGANGQAISGSRVASDWHLAMDIVDGLVSRPFYQGRRVIISPSVGLRAAWIRQSMTVQLTEAAGLFGAGLPFPSGTEPAQPISSHNSSKSWAIGPRVNLEGQWLLGKGFRFEGDFGVSLLYTKYTNIHHKEDAVALIPSDYAITSYLNNQTCLRPEADLGLGIGWGKYFANGRCHIDFSADYDFMIFWSQNVMRQALDAIVTGTSPSAGDLYLHGLTVTGRFDF